MSDRPLGPRERQVYTLALDLYSDRQIAERLGISRHTVEIHVTHIRQKG